MSTWTTGKSTYLDSGRSLAGGLATMPAFMHEPMSESITSMSDSHHRRSTGVGTVLAPFATRAAAPSLPFRSHHVAGDRT